MIIKNNQRTSMVQGLKVKGLMAEINQNLSDLANILNIHRNTLSLKIRNKRPFTATEIKQIADHYNVQVNIFFD